MHRKIINIRQQGFMKQELKPLALLNTSMSFKIGIWKGGLLAGRQQQQGSALVYDGKEFYHSKEYQVRIVDRVGSGDSFASGFIYGLVQK